MVESIYKSSEDSLSCDAHDRSDTRENFAYGAPKYFLYNQNYSDFFKNWKYYFIF